jgi:putative transposase-like DNA-binding protein
VSVSPIALHQGHMVVRTTRPSIGSEKRSAAESERPFCVHGRTRTKTLHGVGLCFFRTLSYTADVATVVLSYKLKLFPTENKADTLALLTRLFCRTHAVATQLLGEMAEPRIPPCKGLGEFTGRAYRRAYTDWRRSLKAARKTGKPFKAPTLRAELLDAAHVQPPRHAKSFDLWVMVQGVGKLYVPARKHRAINRTLAYPGATLCEQGEIFRKNGKWYCRVGVKIPLPEEQPVNEWIGCDVGAKAAVTRSDGYQGPDLRPILKRSRNRRAMLQKHGIAESREMSPQRQVLAREARRAVSVAQRAGRGLALEDPKRLIRWKQHAARFYGKRVLLLAAISGVAVQVIRPPYTSITCSRCGHVEPGQRHRGTFRCWRCGFTHNADINASRVIATRARRVSCASRHGSLSLFPGGGKVE